MQTNSAASTVMEWRPLNCRLPDARKKMSVKHKRSWLTERLHVVKITTGIALLIAALPWTADVATLMRSSEALNSVSSFFLLKVNFIHQNDSHH